MKQTKNNLEFSSHFLSFNFLQDLRLLPFPFLLLKTTARFLTGLFTFLLITVNALLIGCWQIASAFCLFRKPFFLITGHALLIGCWQIAYAFCLFREHFFNNFFSFATNLDLEANVSFFLLIQHTNFTQNCSWLTDGLYNYTTIRI